MRADSHPSASPGPISHQEAELEDGVADELAGGQPEQAEASEPVPDDAALATRALDRVEQAVVQVPAVLASDSAAAAAARPTGAAGSAPPTAGPGIHALAGGLLGLGLLGVGIARVVGVLGRSRRRSGRDGAQLAEPALGPRLGYDDAEGPAPDPEPRKAKPARLSDEELQQRLAPIKGQGRGPRTPQARSGSGSGTCCRCLPGAAGSRGKRGGTPGHHAPLQVAVPSPRSRRNLRPGRFQAWPTGRDMQARSRACPPANTVRRRGGGEVAGRRCSVSCRPRLGDGAASGGVVPTGKTAAAGVEPALLER